MIGKEHFLIKVLFTIVSRDTSSHHDILSVPTVRWPDVAVDSARAHHVHTRSVPRASGLYGLLRLRWFLVRRHSQLRLKSPLLRSSPAFRQHTRVSSFARVVTGCIVLESTLRHSGSWLGRVRCAYNVPFCRLGCRQVLNPKCSYAVSHRLVSPSCCVCVIRHPFEVWAGYHDALIYWWGCLVGVVLIVA